MKPSKREEGRRWLLQAERDFRALRDLLKGRHYHLACFTAQLVAEKALKAYLYYRGREFVFTHSVSRLCDEAAKFSRNFVPLKKQIKALDTYYLEARYPNSIVDNIPADFFDEDDAKGAIEMAQKALKAVRGKIV